MNEVIKKGWGINGFMLKCLAVTTMLIDHVGMALYPGETWMRCIGRLAFPIYCFLLVEGAIHTSDRYRYLKRLFLFACISEIPFDLVRTAKLFDAGAQNVFFTLFLGLLAIELLEKIQTKAYSAIAIVVIVCLAQYGHTDYGPAGILMILCLYIFYNEKYKKLIILAAINIFAWGIGGIQSLAALSIIPMFYYNGTHGSAFKYSWIKYSFYIFYPAHLLVLYWLRFRL